VSVPVTAESTAEPTAERLAVARASLEAGATALGLSLSPPQLASFDRLAAYLREGKRRLSLTALVDPVDVAVKHFLDSLSVLSALPAGSLHVIDVGTGAGFPGLPLAIVNPERHFTLLDSTAKKLKFIEHVAGLLELPNVQTVHTRAENFRPTDRFDIVVSRAVGPIEQFVKWAGHLCVGGGRLLAMKGRDPAAELATLPSGWKVAAIHRLNVPALDEERHLVEICRSHDRL
jgi:16S rRNA (guanine527-N7)-methyltransferase